MNSTLYKQITAYGGIAGLFAGTGSVFGQVVYTDISPDDTVGYQFGNPGFLNFGSLVLDVNNDGQNDFVFGNDYFAGGPCGGYSSVDEFESHGLVVTKIFGTTHMVTTQGNGSCITNKLVIKGLNANDVIGSSQPFQSNKVMVRSYVDMCYAANCYGGMPIGTEKFIGLKLQAGANIHFGWLRFKVTHNMAMALKDYAYESAPGVPISAGDTVSLNTSLTEYIPEISIVVLGKSVTLIGENSLSGGTLMIYDLAGRTIKNIECDKNEINVEMKNQGIFSGIH